MATRFRIEQDKSGYWIVPSETQVGKTYRVSPKGEDSVCTCKDFFARLKPCKHIHAVRFFLKGEVLTEEQEQERQKRPNYPQDWPKYHAARANEYTQFRVLLADLVKDLKNFDMGPDGGRPRVEASDLLFAMALKVYLGFPAGRLHGALVDAQKMGFIKDIPSRNTILSYFGESKLSYVLEKLVEIAALPVRKLETIVAADASGFTTSRFFRWVHEKYGQTASKREWALAHIAVGVKTHVVTAITVTDRSTRECEVAPKLIEQTAKRFFMIEFLADGAYSTKEVLEAAVMNRATPYIPFDMHDTGAAGGIWEKMFHYFLLHRDKFLEHYHQRSNVETVFWMAKSKFWDSVRSKSPVAIRNEVLMKFLCHNICCVHQAT
jgi:transposase